jgi:hypothetical protein
LAQHDGIAVESAATVALAASRALEGDVDEVGQQGRLTEQQ